MTDQADPAATARAFAELMDARDWDRWSALLSQDVIYTIPQTRERIRGRAAYLQFNRTLPGDRHLGSKVVIADAEHAVVWFEWIEPGERGDAQVFLDFDGDGDRAASGSSREAGEPSLPALGTPRGVQAHPPTLMKRHRAASRSIARQRAWPDLALPQPEEVAAVGRVRASGATARPDL